MASQIQLLIALLVLVGVVLVAGVALQSGVAAVPRFAGGPGTQVATGAPLGPGEEPATVVNVFPPDSQSYQVSAPAKYEWVNTGTSCDDPGNGNGGYALAGSEYTCPSDDNCPQGQLCYHKSADRSTGCFCWKEVLIPGPITV